MAISVLNTQLVHHPIVPAILDDAIANAISLRNRIIVKMSEMIKILPVSSDESMK